MTPLIRVGIDQLHKEYAETVNMELFKRYNNQKVSQNIVSKLRKARPKIHEENEAANQFLKNHFPSQDTKNHPIQSEKFKKPYDVSLREPTLKKSPSKLSKQIQNDLWQQINHDKKLVVESQEISNTKRNQQKSEVQQLSNPQGTQQGNENHSNHYRLQ